MDLRLLIDPHYEAHIINTSDLMLYLARHVFIELVFPLITFTAGMHTFFAHWYSIHISTDGRARGNTIGELNENYIE